MVSGRLELCMGCEWGLYISLFCPVHPMGDRKDWDLGGSGWQCLCLLGPVHGTMWCPGSSAALLS